MSSLCVSVVGALGFPMRGMNSSAAPQLSRSGLNQSASQLPSHASTANTGTMHTPPSPSRYGAQIDLGLKLSITDHISLPNTPTSAACNLRLSSSFRGILPMSSRSVLNHSQQVGGPTGQSGSMVGGVGGERGGGGGVGAGRSSSMGSPSRSSPSIIGMPKQQQARQPFTINR